MKKILIDTNFLMVPWQFKVDIFSEFDRICHFNYQLYVFDKTINELENIVVNSGGKDKKAAQFALNLIKSKNIKIIKSGKKYVDLLLLENADKDTVIATLDKKLKKELLKKGQAVIILRQKKYLQIAGGKVYK